MHRSTRFEISQIFQTESDRIPQLVAKLSIPHDSLDVQVDIPALRRVRQQPKPQGISATFWNTVWKVSTLTFFRLHNLFTQYTTQFTTIKNDKQVISNQNKSEVVEI